MTSTSTAARRSKRVVASESPERDEDDMQQDDGDEEDDAQDEPDDEYEDMDIDEDDDELPAEVDELDEEDPAPTLATPTNNAHKTRRTSSSAASASKTPTEAKSTPSTGIKLRLKVSGNGNGNAQPPSPTVPPPAAGAPSRTRPTRTLSNKKSIADAADREGDAPPLTRGTRRKRSLAEVEPEADELASDSQESNSVSASASAARSKKKQKMKTKNSAMGDNETGSDSDEEEEFVTKGRAVERMTARQRSKHDSAFAEELMVLPEDTSKKVVLTEDEKVRRKEEVARRRKLQADQKQENDKREAIDRLLKAQAGRSRNKDLPASRDASTPTNGAAAEPDVPPPPPHLLRYISTIRQGNFEMRLAVPTEKAGILLDLLERNAYGLAGVPAADVDSASMPPLAKPTCAVQGCTEPRKYRCVNDFNIGGCSMAHLKELDVRLQ